MQKLQYIKNHVVGIVDKVLAWFKQWFSSIYRENTTLSTRLLMMEVIFYVSLILNITVWPRLNEHTDG